MKEICNKEELSRRKFLGYSALGLTGLTILPDWTWANGIRIPPSDRVTLGFIGLGRQGVNDFRNFSECPGVEVVAGCDVDQIKRQRFKNVVENWQKSKGFNQRCDLYEFYQDLLNRTDIDAVSIATPEHWHALNTIHACQAKKDAYVQKPLAFTIREGLEMVKSVRLHKRVLQVGSQQRSGKEWQTAIHIVRNLAIGPVETMFCYVGDPPRPFDLPEFPVPASLNWNLWLGPLNDPKIHYHPDLCPPISLDPEEREKIWGAWRWYKETGNGYTSDFGAHMFDIAQAAIGMDGSGPCEYIPKGFGNAQYLTMKYPNGVVMTGQPFHENRKGIQFNGTKGWLKVARGYIECSDPDILAKADAFIEKQRGSGSNSHYQDFIDAVRTRKNPVAPVEVGCSTNTLCCLANIATELKRPVKWNTATLDFGDDAEAANHRLFDYAYRNPYSL